MSPKPAPAFRSHTGLPGSDGHFRLSRCAPQGDVRLQIHHHLVKLRDVERLRAIADGLVGAWVHFDNESVGTDGDACAGEWRHQRTLAGGMTGIEHNQTEDARVRSTPGCRRCLRWRFQFKGLRPLTRSAWQREPASSGQFRSDRETRIHSQANPAGRGDGASHVGA